MGDLKGRMNDVYSSGPVGEITKMSDRFFKDELGRVFEYQSIEASERKRKEGYKKQDKRHFTFTHMQNVREVTDSLSNKLCGYVLMLQPHIQFKTNLLVAKGKQETPLDEKEIAKVLGVQPRTVKSTLQKLEAAEVLAKQENGHYRVNERFHFRKKAGRDADMLVKTFHTTLKSLKVSAADMGFIYKLLPYVHYQTNLICANPFEESPDDVKYLNKSEVAKKAGISRQKAEEVIKRLTKAGVLIASERRALDMENSDDGDGRDTLVILNPRIISRLKFESDHDPLTTQLFAGL